MLFRNIAASALAVAGLSVLGGTANAQFVALPAGTSFPGVNVNETGFVPGALVSSSITQFSDTAPGGASITGNIYQGVFQNGTFLDFVYQLELTSGTTGGVGTQQLSNFSVSSFINFDTQVGETTSDIDGAVAFFSASNNDFSVATRPGAGGPAVNGFLNTEVPVGQRSSIFIIRTNATTFTNTGSATVSASGVSANTSATVLAPASSIVNAPEPGSVALLGVGFAGMAGLVARRRKAA